MANVGRLEIPRIFLVSHETAKYFPRFSRGIQNRENEQAYLLDWRPFALIVMTVESLSRTKVLTGRFSPFKLHVRSYDGQTIKTLLN